MREVNGAMKYQIERAAAGIGVKVEKLFAEWK